MQTREALLEQLTTTAAELIAFYRDLEETQVGVYPEWTARDVLGHLTFWHESFARNLCAAASGEKPNPLRGRLSDLNRQSAIDFRSIPLAEVLQRFHIAQAAIQTHILKPQVVLIPYRKGSRDYTPEEHLEIVNSHIQMHLRDVRSIVNNPHKRPAEPIR